MASVDNVYALAAGVTAWNRYRAESELSLLSRKAIVLLLHGVEISGLDRLRPGLSEDRPVLTWSEGVERVADRIYTAVRQEPRERSSPSH